ncbi:hypothetical protein [Rhodohalobacter sp. SW132]|uniref:hypothetical protein n=1 Tax=Rhodohalobacter sp. SW132 TaxID=2293433 RepID=UPI0011C071C8|nr:hypothetical protein [Rhodohalobacter sp. SW132]
MKKSRKELQPVLMLILTLVLASLAGVATADRAIAQGMDSVEGDRRALEDLYHATNGDQWTYNTAWLDGNPTDRWYGVRTDRNGRVVRLDLYQNNLDGTLPQSIGNLTRLRYLNIKQNELTGEIPESLGNLMQLEWLLLSGVEQKEPNATSDTYPGKENEATNSFSGAIPYIGEMTKLQILEIANQPGFEDTPLPEGLGNLKELWFLSLQRNQHTGEIPESFRNLEKMRHLHLHSNKLSGELPDIFSGWQEARYIRLGGNEFTGNIPPTMGEMRNLRLLSLSNNNFTGPIPEKLTDGSIPAINTIVLQWNELSGSIPDINVNLTVLTVDGNNLSGPIPDLSSSPRIINLGLGWNDFEGEFPDMSHAYQLRYIRARDNNFSGPLPALNPHNGSLANLWFQNNSFSGPIHPSIPAAINNGRDPFGDFNLSGNRFCGPELEELEQQLSRLFKGVDFSSGDQRDPICDDDL